jgi:hypothetical protein
MRNDFASHAEKLEPRQRARKVFSLFVAQLKGIFFQLINYRKRDSKSQIDKSQREKSLFETAL